MAGDWIKMRGALLDHPKVIAIARTLHENREFREWLTPGGGGSVNGQLVSNTALRAVTCALLMCCWSKSREHGKFVGEDLHLPYNRVDDLDEMAGAPGFGHAMAAVEWVKEIGEEKGIFLPNFKEFNVPLTSAEKQKNYRDRRRDGALPSQGNERSKNVTSREEKRRTTTPVVPTGFKAFVEKYPRPRINSKRKALAIWQRDKLEPIAATIVAHVERMASTPDWQREGGKFVPNVTTYLNDARWEAGAPAVPERRLAI